MCVARLPICAKTRACAETAQMPTLSAAFRLCTAAVLNPCLPMVRCRGSSLLRMQPALVALGWGTNKVLPKPNDPPRFLGPQVANMLIVCLALPCLALPCMTQGCMGESICRMVHAALVHTAHLSDTLRACGLCCLLHAASGLLHSLHWRICCVFSVGSCMVCCVHVVYIPLKCWDLSRIQNLFSSNGAYYSYNGSLTQPERPLPTAPRDFEPSVLDAPLDRPCHHSAAPYSTNGEISCSLCVTAL